MVWERRGLVELVLTVGRIAQMNHVICMNKSTVQLLHMHEVRGVAANPSPRYRESYAKRTLLFVCKMALENVRDTCEGGVARPMLPIKRMHTLPTHAFQLQHGLCPSVDMRWITRQPTRIRASSTSRSFALWLAPHSVAVRGVPARSLCGTVPTCRECSACIN